MARFCSSLLICLVIMTIMISYTSHGATLINVLKYGAKRNSGTDSSQAFLKAWDMACNSRESTIIYVPTGKYTLLPVTFRGGDCKNSDTTFHIDGSLTGPSDYRILGRAERWVSFEGVDGVSINGGEFDARGAALWSCKASSSNCPFGATTLSFTNSNNIKLRNVVSLNSQIFHIVIYGCENVQVQGVKVLAAGNSPNTDGIHVQLSKRVSITDSLIKTGDDCISIGPGTNKLLIERIVCGPGHGISIGSLGKDEEEPGVQDVTVVNSVFVGTQNGLRIKSWARPSTGFVQGVQFLGAMMQNVQNPIVIDQHYCPHNINCPGQASGIKINNILYKGIRGTSATPVAIKFDCSSKNPCTGIRMEDVHLTYMNEVAQSSCDNANGRASGLVQPNGCL